MIAFAFLIIHLARKRKALYVCLLVAAIMVYIVIRGLLRLPFYSAHSVGQLAQEIIEDVLSASLVPFLIGAFGFLWYRFFYAALRALFVRLKKGVVVVLAQAFMAFVCALIIVQCAIGVGSLLWEHITLISQYRKEMDRSVVSNTQQDVNVIVVLVDALRADHLGCYGYGRPVSPSLDAFAQEGVRFERCYAQASWTSPSVASLLTSLYPSMHNVSYFHGLPHEAITLAELLQKQGFVTYCYLANPAIRSIYNFNQGFDFFDDYLMRASASRAVFRSLPKVFRMVARILGVRGTKWEDNDSASIANKRIFSWLETHKDQNFFMYLHYMDPHSPYAAPYPYNMMFYSLKEKEIAQSVARYDSEIRFFDDCFKEFLEKLKVLGIYEKTIIIFVSDHGEAFLEHGQREHGNTVYEEEVWVPLMVKYNNRAAQGKVIAAPVRLIDVMPTIVDLLGVKTSNAMEGRSLVPFLQGEKTGVPAPDVFIEKTLELGASVSSGMIEEGKWKYIVSKLPVAGKSGEQEKEELFDLSLDPQELKNLAAEKPERLRHMRQSVRRYQEYCGQKAMKPHVVGKHFEAMEQLQSLGYL